MTQETKETKTASTTAASSPTEAHHDHAPSPQPPVTNKQQQQQQKEESKTMCGMCDVLGSEDEVYCLASCRHRLCLFCLRTHVEKQLDILLEEKDSVDEERKKKFMDITCPLPNCDVSLSKRDLRTGALSSRYKDGPLSLSSLSLSSSLGASGLKGSGLKGSGLLGSGLKGSGVDGLCVSESILELIEHCQDFVRCPNPSCGFVFERFVVDDLPNERVIDEEGREVKGAALEEYHQNRFRCRGCSTVFCSQCKAAPYHLGSTCAQAAAGEQSKQCRFCMAAVDDMSYQEMHGLGEYLDEFVPQDPQKKIADFSDEAENLLLLESLGMFLGDEDEPEAGDLLASERAAFKAEGEEIAGGVISAETPVKGIICNMTGLHRYASNKPNSLSFHLVLTHEREKNEFRIYDHSSFSSSSLSSSNDPPYSSKIMLVANFCAQKQFFVQEIISREQNGVLNVQIHGTYPLRFDGVLEVDYDPKKTDENGFVVATSAKLEGAYFDASRFCLGVYSVSTDWKLPFVGKTQFYTCGEEECQHKLAQSCKKILPCGHICRGVAGEKECLPCVESDCSEFGVLVAPAGGSSSSPLPMQTSGDDFCSICWTEDIRSAPSVLMNCGHVFHKQCVLKKLQEDGFPGPLSFASAVCDCGKRYENADEEITERINYFKKMEEIVHKMVKREVENEKLENDERVTDKTSEFYQKPFEYGLHLFIFYKCDQCSGVVYGGHRNCGPADGQPGPAEGQGNVGGLSRLCKECKDMSGVYGCRLHGSSATIFKCRFCCKIATFFCGSMCHYCDPCHDRAGELTDFSGWKTKDASKLPKCEGVASCPLGVNHPPNGIEHPIGCSICRERSSLSRKDIVPKAMVFTKYSPMILFGEQAKMVEFTKKSDSDVKLFNECEPGQILFKPPQTSSQSPFSSSYSFSPSSPLSLSLSLPSSTFSPSHNYGISFTITKYTSKKFSGVIFDIPGCLEMCGGNNCFVLAGGGGGRFTVHHYFDSEKNGRKPVEEEGGVVKVFLTWNSNGINMCSSRGFISDQKMKIPDIKQNSKIYIGNSPAKQDSPTLSANITNFCFWAEKEEEGGVDVVDMENFFCYQTVFMEEEVGRRVSGEGEEKEKEEKEEKEEKGKERE